MWSRRRRRTGRPRPVRRHRVGSDLGHRSRPASPSTRRRYSSEEAATGPASAVFVAPQADAADVATWFQGHLEEAAYSTYALSGPLEDGSYVIDSIGQDDDCRTEVTIAPLGGTISVTVRYGAGCPPD